MTTQSAAPAVQHPAVVERQGLIQWAGSKFGVDAGKVFPILKQTCFKAGDGKEASDAEVAALMIVAREHGLNPFLKEIYAFPDKKGGIVPVVGVDGWIRIVNEHPEFNGVEFVDSQETTEHAGKKVPVWREVHFFRKDRAHPIKIREFFAEVVRDTQPWKSHPNRMFRHKTLIQGARVAFGFAGIYDEDEAERIIEATEVVTTAAGQEPKRIGAAGLKDALKNGDGIDLGGAGPTSAPAGKAPAGKEHGSLELRQKYEEQFKACKDAETLALARDEANAYEWTDADRAALDAAYKARAEEL